jgi:hypothetical protein
MKQRTAQARASRSIAAFVIAIFAFVLVCAAFVHTLSGKAKASATTLYAVDFTDYASGPVDAWLRAKGFAFERDAKNAGAIAFRAGAQGLQVAALKRAQGLLINKTIGANPYSAIEIEWGVDRHPQGASYEKNVNNEAIMVHVFFGSEKKPSGSLFAPDIPYFIGLFLCNGDRIGHAYQGRYYQEGGRYVCLDAPRPGQTVVSRFNLKEGVRAIFGNRAAESVTGYSIEVDTSASHGDGKSSAFIKRIRFVS